MQIAKIVLPSGRSLFTLCAAKQTRKERTMARRSVNDVSSEDVKQKLLKIAKFGFSESDTAILANISAAELKKMMKLDAEFGRNYKKAELEAQFEVEAAFHSRACGYQTIEVIHVYSPIAGKGPENKDNAVTSNKGFDDVSQELILHSKTLCGNEADMKSEIRNMIAAGLDVKLKEVRFVKKFLPPDTSSCITWLINRRSERWSKNPTGGGALTSRNSKGSGK